jgi:N-acetylglucosaminyl-diphospho-decaprenol L-rhamnosyltransferase
METYARPAVSVSVVSHGHGRMLANLLADLDRCSSTELEVLLTLNIAEDLPFTPSQFRFPMKIIANTVPKGFGTNHNAGFRASQHPLFCVLNPDIRLPSDPFPKLAQRLENASTGIVAPLARTSEGGVEASARRFPTPFLILRKALFGPEPPGYDSGGPDIAADWVGGMFMLFRRETFEAVGGFDEHYHLYYEDVDICARVRTAGREIVLCPTVEVIHDAQRQSHSSPRYFAWHVVSMLRFFFSRPFRRLVIFGHRRSRASGVSRK